MGLLRDGNNVYIVAPRRKEDCGLRSGHIAKVTRKLVVPLYF